MSQVPRLTLPGILIQMIMSIIPSDSGMLVIITQLKILSVMRCSPMAWFKWFIGEISNQGGILKMQKYSRVPTSGQGLRWKRVSRGPKFLTQCYCSSVTFSAFVHLRPHAWHHRLNSIFWNTITIKWWIFFCEDQILNFEWILNWVLQQNKYYSKQISLLWVQNTAFWGIFGWFPLGFHIVGISPTCWQPSPDTRELFQITRDSPVFVIFCSFAQRLLQISLQLVVRGINSNWLFACGWRWSSTHPQKNEPWRRG